MQPMVFTETPNFTQSVLELLSDEAYGELQQELRQRPSMGAIIQGTGGIRKTRVALPGRGKRGGARVIYYWRVSESQILMLDIYAKNVRADLTKDQKAALKKIVEEWS